ASSAALLPRGAPRLGVLGIRARVAAHGVVDERVGLRGSTLQPCRPHTPHFRAPRGVAPGGLPSRLPARGRPHDEMYAGTVRGPLRRLLDLLVLASHPAF